MKQGWNSVDALKDVVGFVFVDVEGGGSDASVFEGLC